MSGRSIIGSTEAELTPEEAALLMRLSVSVNMRWLAILSVIAATLLASRVFGIQFATLPIYIICLITAAYNAFFLRQFRSLRQDKAGSIVRKARSYGNIQIFLDLLALTAVLHFSGGIENPFIFYFVFHVLLASIALRYTTVYLLATSAIVMVTLLVVLEYTGVIPHVHLVGFAPADLYRQNSYVIAVLLALTTLLYASAYMVTAISGELRKRQREVLQLREKELEISSREIAKLEEEKTRFLRFIGVAAHDLKAPLAAIQGYIGVMLGGFSGELNEKQRNMLDRSSYRINELLHLISDLLDIPRIETGQIVPEMKELSLAQVIKSCLDDHRKLAEEKGLQLTAELPDNLPDIYGSAPRLQQVVTNLLSNALAYTPEGAIMLRIKDCPDCLAVEVADTGIGIPPGDLPKLFTDFYRGGNVDKKGTGLGLSISKRIVEAHGGKIWAESPCPDSMIGSRFTFTLPKTSSVKGDVP